MIKFFMLTCTFIMASGHLYGQQYKLNAAASQVPVLGVIQLENGEVRTARGGSRWYFDVEYPESIVDGINGDFISTGDLVTSHDIATGISRRNKDEYAVLEGVIEPDNECRVHNNQYRFRIRNASTGESTDTISIPIRSYPVNNNIEVHALNRMFIWRDGNLIRGYQPRRPNSVTHFGNRILNDYALPNMYTTTASGSELYASTNGEYEYYDMDNGCIWGGEKPQSLGEVYAVLDDPGTVSEGGLLIAEGGAVRITRNDTVHIKYDRDYTFHNIAALRGVLSHLPSDVPIFAGVFSVGNDALRYYGIGRLIDNQVKIEFGGQVDDLNSLYFHSFDASRVDGNDRIQFAANLRLRDTPIDFVFATTDGIESDLAQFGKTNVTLDNAILELSIVDQDTSYLISPVVTNRNTWTIQELMLSGKFPRRHFEGLYESCNDFAEFSYRNLELAPGETRVLSPVRLNSEKGEFTADRIQFDITLDAADDRPILDGSLRYASATVEFTSSSRSPVLDELIAVSPNPTSSVLNVESELNLKRKVQLVNGNGKSWDASLANNTILLYGIPPGFYVLKLETIEGLQVHRKIVIQ